MEEASNSEVPQIGAMENREVLETVGDLELQRRHLTKRAIELANEVVRLKIELAEEKDEELSGELAMVAERLREQASGVTGLSGLEEENGVRGDDQSVKADVKQRPAD